MDRQKLEEAKAVIKTVMCADCVYTENKTICMRTECGQSQKLAIECIEKQIPMKPIITIYDDDCIEYWNCPCCGVQYGRKELPNFCGKCGKALDWSDYGTEYT